MRTLIYCTAHAATLGEWTRRYRPWLDAVRRLGLADQILIADDASPVLPGWDDLRVSSGDGVDDAAPPGRPEVAILHRFSHRLGRLAMFDCPGWYRSYGFGADYAVRHGFDRVVHLESDAYLLSGRMRDYVRSFRDGWAALWTERYQFPELAIQLAAGDGLRAFHDFTRRPYDQLVDRVHEYLVPFTAVERGLTGDRYGETNGPIPRGVDYVCQVPTQREAPYYWWLPQGAGYAADAVAEEQALAFRFQAGDDTGLVRGAGWSDPEPDFCWMTGFSSTLRLPPLTHSGQYVLRLNVHPLLFGPAVPRQNLRVLVNGRQVAAFQISGDLIIGAIVPAGLLRGDGNDAIEFVHPDAVAPAVLTGSDDPRVLSLALRHLALVPVRAG